MQFELKYKRMGDSAILIEWPQRISNDVNKDIIRFTEIVLKVYKHQLINHIPAYASLLLHFKDLVDFEQLNKELQMLYFEKNNKHLRLVKEWHIPVCYHPTLALDMDSFVSEGLSFEAVVRIHTSAEYRVCMIGFLPGFVYLGGLDDRLFKNRKITPRMQVPSGAVAIGGKQTGIYPLQSPGGWHIIGQTPLSLFDIRKEKPIPIMLGDTVHFYSINLETYNILKS